MVKGQNLAYQFLHGSSLPGHEDPFQGSKTNLDQNHLYTTYFSLVT
jgi:hypothetical protein